MKPDVFLVGPPIFGDMCCTSTWPHVVVASFLGWIVNYHLLSVWRSPPPPACRSTRTRWVCQRSERKQAISILKRVVMSYCTGCCSSSMWLFLETRVPPNHQESFSVANQPLLRVPRFKKRLYQWWQPYWATILIMINHWPLLSTIDLFLVKALGTVPVNKKQMEKKQLSLEATPAKKPAVSNPAPTIRQSFTKH